MVSSWTVSGSEGVWSGGHRPPSARGGRCPPYTSGTLWPLEDHPEPQVERRAVLRELHGGVLAPGGPPRPGRADLVLPVQERASADHEVLGGCLRRGRACWITDGIRRADVRRPDVAAPFSDVACQV